MTGSSSPAGDQYSHALLRTAPDRIGLDAIEILDAAGGRTPTAHRAVLAVTGRERVGDFPY
jgi:hypothetical protein